MCNYSYSKFVQCDHRVIDVTWYCEKALWRAGLAGQLVPCREVTFSYHLAKAVDTETMMPEDMSPEDEGKHIWIGLTGICKACTKQQRIPQIAAFASHRNTHLSTFSSQAVAFQIYSHDVAPLPDLQISPDHPYVFLPALNHSVFDLLGIAQYYSDVDQSTCKMLLFPSSNFLYTRQKWASNALVNGGPIAEVPNNYFFSNCGLTPLDRRYIASEVARGVRLEDIWNSTFARRGTHKEMFLHAAALPEVFPPRRIFSEQPPRPPVANYEVAAPAIADYPNALPNVQIKSRLRRNAKRTAISPVFNGTTLVAGSFVGSPDAPVDQRTCRDVKRGSALPGFDNAAASRAGSPLAPPIAQLMNAGLHRNTKRIATSSTASPNSTIAGKMADAKIVVESPIASPNAKVDPILIYGQDSCGSLLASPHFRVDQRLFGAKVEVEEGVAFDEYDHFNGDFEAVIHYNDLPWAVGSKPL